MYGPAHYRSSPQDGCQRLLLRGLEDDGHANGGMQERRLGLWAAFLVFLN